MWQLYWASFRYHACQIFPEKYVTPQTALVVRTWEEAKIILDELSRRHQAVRLGSGAFRAGQWGLYPRPKLGIQLVSFKLNVISLHPDKMDSGTLCSFLANCI